MKILITGGAGFIGSHLVRHFEGRAEVVVLDNLRSGYRKNLEGTRHTFIEGSITDPDAVSASMEGVDLVFNLAAMVSVPESIQRGGECVEINVLGLLNLLDAAARCGVRKFVHASSAAVYGDNPVSPKTEDMRPEPKSPYAVTKLDGEYYLEIYRENHGLETASLRFFNVFGPRQDPASAYAAAVPIFIEKALRGEPLTIFGDGGQTRDFVYVKDVAAALEHVAVTPDLSGSFNVGYHRTITIRDLAERIIEASGSNSPIHFEAPRPGDIRHSEASNRKLVETGFTPLSSFEEGLAETIESFRSAIARTSA